MTTEEFSYWFDKIEGVQVIKLDTDKVYFSLGSENLIKKITKTSNLSDNFLSLHDDKEGIIFCIHRHKLDKFIEIWENKCAVNAKYGTPDLSFVTVSQMMHELKKRQNISFVFVMSENLNVSNITLEASGNPTYLCGLLARGQHLANKFAEKDIKYHQEGEDFPTS
jgi:hypothetical protein